MDIPCPYRYVRRGRTFCHLAIDERKYTTTEVVPLACSTCRIPAILSQHPCRHLSFGVEIDEYGGRLTAEVCYIACEAKVMRLFDFNQCGQGICPHWEPWNQEEAVQRAAQAAKEDRRRREEDQKSFAEED
ncbi:MAG: hypothetical protein ACUVX8_05090 [Candidatus Zipacnadales bacterium]